MPVAAFVPNRIHTDYSEWTAPGIAYNGHVWAWNNTSGKYEPTALAFDPSGTAAAAIATHLAASNPHSQYLLASGVSAFGATLVDDADAAAARTTLGLGTAATLNVGTGANNIVQLNGSGQLPAVSGALLTNLPAGSAAGSTTQVQFNNAGSFAGDAGMTYDAANDRLTVAGGLVAPSMRPASNSTTAVQLQNASGTAVVTVDTTNKRVTIDGGFGTVGGVNAPLQVQVDGAGRAFSLSLSATEYTDFVSGGVLKGMRGFGTVPFIIQNAGDIYFAPGGSERVRIKTDGNIGTGGNSTPSALLDLAASTTARASLRIRAGTAPTTPNAGDCWFDGANLKFYDGTTTRTITWT